MEACRRGLEGLIAKRAESPYSGKRSTDWLKLKCSHEQELVIGGFTAPHGKRTDFGALLVGYYEDGELRYAGKVGTGFDQRTLSDLGEQMRKLRAPDPPFADVHPIPKGTHWIEPKLVGQFALQRVDPRRPPAPPAIPRAARRQASSRKSSESVRSELMLVRAAAGEADRAGPGGEGERRVRIHAPGECEGEGGGERVPGAVGVGDRAGQRRGGPACPAAPGRSRIGLPRRRGSRPEASAAGSSALAKAVSNSSSSL